MPRKSVKKYNKGRSTYEKRYAAQVARRKRDITLARALKSSGMTVSTSLSGGGNPEVKIVKMKYCGMRQVATSSGVVGSWVIRANSIYDPDWETGGHQPSYYDFYAQLYERYCVVKSKITVDFQTRGNTAANNFMITCGIEYIGGYAYATGSTTKAIEQKDAKFCRINNYCLAPNNHGRVSQTYNPRYRLGISDAYIDNYNISAVGENPTRNAGFRIFVGYTDDATDIANVQCDAVITYWVRFSGARTVDQS